VAAGAVSLAVVVSAHTLLGEMGPKNLVPWERVTSVDDSMSLAEMRQIAAGAGHSRLPVLRGDKVAGFVHVLDLHGAPPSCP
jgi:CBS domain containing-hemolysin-like protein